MKKVNSQVDLTEWGLPKLDEALDGLRKLVVGTAEEALQYAIESNDSSCSFPAVWGETDGCGNSPPEDPLTIYISLPLGPESDEPQFRLSLSDELRRYIEDCREDGSFADGLSRIRDALRSLANEIDSALPPSNTEAGP